MKPETHITKTIACLNIVFNYHLFQKDNNQFDDPALISYGKKFLEEINALEINDAQIKEKLASCIGAYAEIIGDINKRKKIKRDYIKLVLERAREGLLANKPPLLMPSPEEEKDVDIENEVNILCKTIKRHALSDYIDDFYGSHLAGTAASTIYPAMLEIIQLPGEFKSYFYDPSNLNGWLGGVKYISAILEMFGDVNRENLAEYYQKLADLNSPRLIYFLAYLYLGFGNIDDHSDLLIEIIKKIIVFSTHRNILQQVFLYYKLELFRDLKNIYEDLKKFNKRGVLPDTQYNAVMNLFGQAELLFTQGKRLDENYQLHLERELQDLDDEVKDYLGYLGCRNGLLKSVPLIEKMLDHAKKRLNIPGEGYKGVIDYFYSLEENSSEEEEWEGQEQDEEEREEEWDKENGKEEIEEESTEELFEKVWKEQSTSQQEPVEKNKKDQKILKRETDLSESSSEENSAEEEQNERRLEKNVMIHDQIIPQISHLIPPGLLTEYRDSFFKQKKDSRNNSNNNHPNNNNNSNSNGNGNGNGNNHRDPDEKTLSEELMELLKRFSAKH